MRSFRRVPGAEHLVHAVDLPELSRRRRAPASKLGSNGAHVLRVRHVGGDRDQGASEQGAIRAAVAQTVRESPPAPVAPAPSEQERIDLLERRLAKLTRLLATREDEMQLRTERGAPDSGLPSVYTEVQGVRGDSEEALRKRSLMSSIFEANRKLRERIGSAAGEAE
jgi:hypothetical protein